MASLFRQIGIYAPQGQFINGGSNLCCISREADGQLLEEGITEAGALPRGCCCYSYSVHNLPLPPLLYLLLDFGFQRVVISYGLRLISERVVFS